MPWSFKESLVKYNEFDTLRSYLSTNIYTFPDTFVSFENQNWSFWLLKNTRNLEWIIVCVLHLSEIQSNFT